MPTSFGKTVKAVVEATDARVDVHTHDDFGMAAANAVTGFENGAEQAQVSVNGIGRASCRERV